MADPENTEKSLDEMTKIMKRFTTSNKFLYPDKIMDPIIQNMVTGGDVRKISPPKTVFIPSSKLIRKVAEIILTHGEHDSPK